MGRKEGPEVDQYKAMTAEEIADRLGVHVKTVQRWLREGKIRGFKAGSRWRITFHDFEMFTRGREEGEPGGSQNTR